LESSDQNEDVLIEEENEAEGPYVFKYDGVVYSKLKSEGYFDESSLINGVD
jgi:hypothetical protein